MVRRVQRRMQVLQIDNVPEFIERLRKDAGEVETLLFQDLLIGVTNFFRDPEAFAALEERGHPAAVRGQGAGRHGARLGARLRHRRGGLFDRHPAARAHAARG